jgi:hypothetical protein
MKCGDLLTNKYVLYLTLFVAIMHIIGYIAIGNEDAIIFFVVIGILSTFFSNNMIIILVIAIVATNVFLTRSVVQEGLENNIKKKKREYLTKQQQKELAEEKTEEFTQQNIKPSQPAPVTESEEDEAIGHRIDYASTLEQAYDNLQQMLGPDGINGLSKETKNLVFQQKSLMKNLNDMAPVLKTAKETLDTMSGDLPNLDKIKSLMGSFSGGLVGGGKKDDKKRN